MSISIRKRHSRITKSTQSLNCNKAFELSLNIDIFFFIFVYVNVNNKYIYLNVVRHRSCADKS